MSARSLVLCKFGSGSRHGVARNGRSRLSNVRALGWANNPRMLLPKMLLVVARHPLIAQDLAGLESDPGFLSSREWGGGWA